jgi:hypothetical protein
VASEILPLVKRILEVPKNKNSSFGYYRKYDICHFPTGSINGFDGALTGGEIYRLPVSERFCDDISGQMRFF